MSLEVLNEIRSRTLLMGIINTTPDSFSDGGEIDSPDAAVKRAKTHIENGADILDLGGESTRPGAEPVEEGVEIERVIPALKAIRNEFSDICISIDTYKSGVAQAALEAGADLVNDISALRFDEKMGHVIASAGCPAILMHMRGTPSSMNESALYGNLLGEVIDFFRERLDIAATYGIDKQKLILDPGLGFAKGPAQNLELLKRLAEIRDLGKPVLIGPSRKLFHEEFRAKRFRERIGDTIAASVVGVLNGANIIRAHELGELRDAMRVVDALP